MIFFSLSLSFTSSYSQQLILVIKILSNEGMEWTVKRPRAQLILKKTKKKTQQTITNHFHFNKISTDEEHNENEIAFDSREAIKTIAVSCTRSICLTRIIIFIVLYQIEYPIDWDLHANEREMSFGAARLSPVGTWENGVMEMVFDVHASCVHEREREIFS